MSKFLFQYFWITLFSGAVMAEEGVYIPLGGNTWVKGGSTAKITEKGLADWSNSTEVPEIYVYLAKAGELNVTLNLSTAGTAQLELSALGKSQKVDVSPKFEKFLVGKWIVEKAGYLKIAVRGISKTSATFAEINGITVDGSAVNEKMAFVKDNKDGYFYWGRRGPSVHLSYTMPENEEVEWFYNEVTVPEDQDVIGSYYMANGFAEGYFGMQVNSEKERRILFSVWSPFHTDDPKSIPKDKQIKMLGKGKDVYTGEFGNEGSGGQSYLKYNWKAENTYRFLLRGKPTGDSTTTYTAYFFAPEENQWRLIASFQRPKTQTYLKRFHSFLENFIPEMGDVSRQVNFGNQWIKSSSAKWSELTEAKFTADATARKGYRLDYAGGQQKDVFFLKNCGFFNETTHINTLFTRKASGKEPDVDFEVIDRLSAGISDKP
ncbi:DUF3472 domain-containing protein [Dyadobacter sp. CY312]|uniref:DUF3472 domain-containing protein n=1 Tax=Dyadobacter sp. CY312 TaxID=2907303 RepID=UPI001F47B3F1|nr:DUF3472 domain-containing protein [Dyadobacter sp. CY312]MCE7042338.1 DUF3472 domain-containing protein [Dyadobacter sp. CY312]